MSSKGLCVKVEHHGTALDKQKKRVSCNHCGKIVSGFSRLKCHLGGVQEDVVPCLQVPGDVKEVFRNEILEKKRGNFSKEVGELFQPNQPLRRNSGPLSSSAEPCRQEFNQTSRLGSAKRLKMVTPSEDCGMESASFTRTTLGPQSSVSTQSSSSSEFQKRIGRFFYEAGIDFSATKSPSFQRMINANFGSEETAYAIPSCEDLRGWILLEAVKEMQQYVKEIQSSWGNTGCSILLDGWDDSTGRNFVNALASCPKGTVYIQSADISGFEEESDTLLKFLEDVLKEVGVGNVVQIIAYSTSASMKKVGEQLMEKYNLFWTVSVSHCLELMLEKIRMMEVVKEIMDKVKTITSFMHGNASVLKLLKDQTYDYDLDRPSNFKFTVAFSTLEYMVSKKENLQGLFVSHVWKTSSWASTSEGKRVADLVADHSFWTEAITVLKATTPLLHALDLTAKNNEPQLGYIYKTIHQAKETIVKEFKHKESAYMPFLKAIDEVWNGYLHSPLHAAGYFLNPKLFYASGIYTNWRVASGLYSCVLRMANRIRFQDEIALQIQEYWTSQGTSVQLQSDASPGSWWLEYGRRCPELRRLAVRVLSQTCNGASQYKLKRSLAEKLLTKGRNPIEQQRLVDLVFVHYNLQLQNFNVGASTNLQSNDIYLVDD